jgi:predicted phosphodiesterase
MFCEDCGAKLMKNGKRTTLQGVIFQQFVCKSCKKNSSIKIEDEITTDRDEILELTENLSRRLIKAQDLNRIEKSTYRKLVRRDNAFDEFFKFLKDQFEKDPIKNPEFKSNPISISGDSPVGVFQISDVHFGELINIDSNKFDFEVASKRFKKFVTTAIRIFKGEGIKKVLVAMTGDIFNSNRRTDEILSQASSRANALFIGYKIIEQVISELAVHFEIEVTAVSGNESRIEIEFGWTDSNLNDNFDFILFNILKLQFSNTNSRVKFIDSDFEKSIIRIKDNNFMFLHGNQIDQKKNIDKSISEIRGKFAANDIIVDFLVFGHIHQSLLSDFFARSGSLCGGNVYSERALQLASRASQNLFIVRGKKDVIPMKIDLQDTTEDKYEIADFSGRYETKSISKAIREGLVYTIS